MVALDSCTCDPNTCTLPVYAVSVFDISKDFYGVLTFSKDALYINNLGLDSPR
jgi:hypothetical protein